MLAGCQLLARAGDDALVGQEASGCRNRELLASFLSSAAQGSMYHLRQIARIQGLATVAGIVTV